MLKGRAAIVAASLAILALVSAAAWGALRTRTTSRVRTNGAPPSSQAVPITVIGMADAPADVQEAAVRLMHSRVGYAIAGADKTYLIISTGTDSAKVKLNGAEGQPGIGTPTFVELNLSTSSTGERLLIATTALAGTAEFQFNLDGNAAAIPTLRNPHGLPLVTLSETSRFVALAPAAEQLVTGSAIEVQGYARVFEAQFTVRVVSATGRVLGEQHVMAAAGAPSWGSFSTEVALNGSDLPEMGFVVFEEGQTEAKLVVPVRFRTPPQMG